MAPPKLARVGTPATNKVPASHREGTAPYYLPLPARSLLHPPLTLEILIIRAVEAVDCGHLIHLIVVPIGFGVEQLEERPRLIAALKHCIINRWVHPYSGSRLIMV